MAVNYSLMSPYRQQTAQTSTDFNTRNLNQQAVDLEGQDYNVGTFYTEPAGAKQSGLGMETQRERYINQQRNYSYGRDPAAADAAVAAARSTAGQYASQLNQVSGDAYRQGALLQKRATPETNYALSDAARAQQQQVFGANMAAGQAPEGPSAAAAQLQAGTNRALAGQLALARSGRGAGESASAMRGAAFNTAGIQQDAANSAAMLRAQEDQAFRNRQLQAYNQAGGLVTGQRAQDVGQTQFLTQAELQSRGINDQAGLGYTNAALGGYGEAGKTALSGEELANLIRAQQLEGSMGYETNLTNYAIGKQADQGGSDWQDYAKTGIAAAGTAAAFMSDRRAKTDITPLERKAQDTVRKAPGYSYRYTDPDAEGAAHGTQYGPMAQDLEKTSLGASTVKEGSDGFKRVDTGRLALINTAALHAQQKEIDKLSKMLRAR